MNKQEFQDQLRARTNEIQEMEDLVQDYSRTIKHLSGMLKASMIVAYRKGIVDLLGMLDHKAIKKKQERDAVNKLTQDTRGTI